MPKKTECTFIRAGFFVCWTVEPINYNIKWSALSKLRNSFELIAASGYESNFSDPHVQIWLTF